MSRYEVAGPFESSMRVAWRWAVAAVILSLAGGICLGYAWCLAAGRGM